MRKTSNAGTLAFELRENSPQLIDKSVVIGRIVRNKRPNLKIRIDLINLIFDDNVMLPFRGCHNLEGIRKSVLPNDRQCEPSSLCV